jgi:hypothetical protein
MFFQGGNLGQSLLWAAIGLLPATLGYFFHGF